MSPNEKILYFNVRRLKIIRKRWTKHVGFVLTLSDPPPDPLSHAQFIFQIKFTAAGQTEAKKHFF